MPYIYRFRKNFFDVLLESLHDIQSSGELTYVLTAVIIKYLREDKLTFERINNAVGALESTKLELVRRVGVPYETKKCEDNGDAYDVDDLLGRR